MGKCWQVLCMTALLLPPRSNKVGSKWAEWGRTALTKRKEPKLPKRRVGRSGKVGRTKVCWGRHMPHLSQMPHSLRRWRLLYVKASSRAGGRWSCDPA